MTPNAHERAEWARLAQDAYRTGRNDFGHRFSARAAVGGYMPLEVFDTLQTIYRRWLIGGWAEVEAPR